MQQLSFQAQAPFEQSQSFQAQTPLGQPTLFQAQTPFAQPPPPPQAQTPLAQPPPFQARSQLNQQPQGNLERLLRYLRERRVSQRQPPTVGVPNSKSNPNRRKGMLANGDLSRLPNDIRRNVLRVRQQMQNSARNASPNQSLFKTLSDQRVLTQDPRTLPRYVEPQNGSNRFTADKFRKSLIMGRFGSILPPVAKNVNSVPRKQQSLPALRVKTSFVPVYNIPPSDTGSMYELMNQVKSKLDVDAAVARQNAGKNTGL